MFDAEQTLKTDPEVTGGGQDAEAPAPSGSGSSSSDATKQDELAVFERATGRKFTNTAEAEQYLRNLNGLVGDNAVANARKKAEFADAFIAQYALEKGMSHDDAHRELQSLVTPSKTRQPVSLSEEKRADDPRLESLEREMFLTKNPEASPYIDNVSRYAKAQNMGLKEAYNELYGTVLATKAKEQQLEAKRKEKQSASLSTSTSAPAAGSVPRSKELLEQFRRTGDESFYMAAVKARSKEAAGRQDQE